MNNTKLLICSALFEANSKFASIRGNMAKRIFFSLLQHLVPATEQSRIYLTDGVIDPLALRQIVPGAEELLRYGIQACIEEIKYIDNKQIIPYLKSLPDKTCLEKLIELFNQPNWKCGFGGLAWKNIAQTLLNIQSNLLAAKQYKKDRNEKEEIKYLRNVLIYMNVLDGIQHNTGSLLRKMREIEQEEQEELGQNIDHIQSLEDAAKTKKIMDAKELPNPDDTLSVILPVLEKETDAPLTMKDWIERARQRIKSNPEQVRQKLFRVNDKKEAIKRINRHLTPIKNKIVELLSMENRLNNGNAFDKYIIYTNQYGKDFSQFAYIISNTAGYLALKPHLFNKNTLDEINNIRKKLTTTYQTASLALQSNPNLMKDFFKLCANSIDRLKYLAEMIEI